jgi:NAD(P)H-nitrite reductase large subunit
MDKPTDPTFQRHDFKDNDLVCYCFQYTKKQIEEDYVNHGCSTILERVRREKQIGGCDCAQKNPRGR